MKKFGLYIVGYKGRLVLESISFTPEFVVTYLDKNTDKIDYDKIIKICNDRNIHVYHKTDDNIPVMTADLLFYIGWQFIIRDNMDKSIVIHDSYLPTMKGFSPTPTALIMGCNLGATAFQPTDVIDTGQIYLRRKINIEHPMRLSEANSVIGRNYVEMVEEIITQDIIPYEILNIGETFSIWRDSEDMIIQWSDDVYKIQRFVYALGSPLSGAKTFYKGKEIIVKDVEASSVEQIFEERHVGKIWSIDENRPKIICGTGMLTITDAVDENGETVIFDRLRQRMGK